MRRVSLGIVLAAVTALLLVQPSAFARKKAADAGYCVRAFGAKGDGVAKDTLAVQKAIDKCAENGGGAVVFRTGTYLCGSLHLRAGVTLEVEAGATIKGSPDKADYDPYEKLEFKNAADEETTYFHSALIWAEDVERIAIVGQGTIDGNRHHRGGPKALAFKRCKFVDVKGVHIVNIPNYAISLLGTDYVNIDGVTILEAHADGIDPDACRNVRISNCHIESHDDAIVPKASFSLGERRAVENVTVTNCYLATDCNCFKLGTESGGDFKRIAVSNCVMASLGRGRPASGGVCLESVDGSNIDGVVVSNITMYDVRAPIFVRLGNRGRDMAPPAPGSLRNVSIDNIVAVDATNTCSISGIPGANVKDVTLSDVRVTFRGGCPYRPPEDPVPENIDEYPDPNIFDALPAYGLYCRHIEGLTLSNVQLALQENYWRLAPRENVKTTWETPDGVPQPSKPGQAGFAVVCDDVARLDIDGLKAQASAEGMPVLRFANVRNALVRGCVALDGTKTYLELAGGQTARVNLIGNVFTAAEKTIACVDGADAKSVACEANVGRR